MGDLGKHLSLEAATKTQAQLGSILFRRQSLRARGRPQEHPSKSL